ncbi:allantoicase [Magnaporthiopsis poae ATCC 64411]|uniref:Allantoicase n=1 Tax=Magnaporthiopsis poae (strain ATCC 64411 / 73-15) TaxID=644358 RepID=A0A0C4DWI9_MAGP6|nr:allantoicase [Magnaporthiopsis poae ATCC 64411]
MADDEVTYKLEDVPATPVASDQIDKEFRSTSIDLISAALGGKVLAFSDQWFAEAANLLTPTPPVRQPGKMCGPDQEHTFESLVKDDTFTHVKLVMIPDGGIKRLRVLGTRAAV